MVTRRAPQVGDTHHLGHVAVAVLVLVLVMSGALYRKTSPNSKAGAFKQRFDFTDDAADKHETGGEDNGAVQHHGAGQHGATTETDYGARHTHEGRSRSKRPPSQPGAGHNYDGVGPGAQPAHHGHGPGRRNGHGNGHDNGSGAGSAKGDGQGNDS